MQGNNPYTLMFGKEPPQAINRVTQLAEVTDSFNAEQPSQQMFMISGIRGSGKTVFMTEIAKELGKGKEWVIVRLNSTQNLLEDLAAALASENYLARIFQKASINLSLFGIGLEVKGIAPVSSIQIALTKMLESLKEHDRKLLICIDEVSVTEYMKAFAGAYQIFLGQDLPVYLLMTGLYDNINDLRNEKNLTFLYRAPRMELLPLNLSNIADNYRKNLNIGDEEAERMAKLTRGYSFAFQVLGYFTWKYTGDLEKAIPDTRSYLDEYVYDKVWSEMSHNDRKFAYHTARSEDGRAKTIKESSGFSDRDYSVYRDRLIKRGILNGKEHGIVRFTLPMFEDYAIMNFIP